MTIWKALVAVMALAAVAGCTGKRISGTYVAQDAHGAAMLQLTQSSSDKLTGSLTVVQLLPDGTSQRTDISVTDGTVDPNHRSFVLSMKANALLAQSGNVSGEVTGAGVDLTTPESVVHLTTGTPADFYRATHSLAAAGQKQQEQAVLAKREADNAKRVQGLTHALAGYNTWVASSTQGPEAARRQEEQLVAAARKDLAIERTLASQHQDFAAGQARFRIGQLAFQMGQLKLQIEQAVQTGHDHLAGFDRGIAQSPCLGERGLPGCDALAKAQAGYSLTRAKVVSNLEQLSDDLHTNLATMDGLNKAAGN